MRASSGLRRRRLLQGTGAAAALASLGLTATPAAAAADARVATRSLAEAARLFGAMPVASPLITLDLPALVDNGEAVPVSVSSALRGTREIVLLVEANPQLVAVSFSLPAGTEPFVATRIRLAASGSVVAAVRCDEGLFVASRGVAVTVGGCG